jgi:hypothetical protein
MKADQFRKLLMAAAQMQQDSGNTDASQALNDIAGLLPERGTMTVAAFAAQVTKVAADDTTSA